MDDHKVVAVVGGQEKGFLLEFCSDGVFFTAYPDEDGTLSSDMSELSQFLEDFKVNDYDLMVLTDAIRKSDGEPVLLGKEYSIPKDFEGELLETGDEFKHGRLVYGKTIIDIAKDKLSATLRFDLAEGEVVPPLETVIEEIGKKRIKFGLIDGAINQAMETRKPVVIARGIPPQNGRDAIIRRNFDMGEKGRPVVDEHDRADYKNLNMFLRAVKGQYLAERVPHTQGVDGMNIFGDIMRAKNGKPKPVPQGKNTSIQDEHFLIADIDGQIIDKGTKIEVDPRLEIKGDVGMGTGNLDFDGAISIQGNVEAGFVVKATGDIEIGGMVSGADVEGRNIVVKGGVRGMHRGRIKAQEDFRASFVENGDIEAGGDVYITDIVMHSNVRAGHFLVMDEGKGRITGGNLAAGEEIRAKCVGNEANVVTRLSVGVNPMLQREQQTILKEYHEAKKRLDQLSKTLSTIDKIDIKSLPPAKAEQLNALVRSQFPLMGYVQRHEKRLKEIDAELQQMRHGRIRVSEVMYPGVRLSINSIIKNVQVKESNCTQYVKDDFIVVGAY